MQSKTFVQTFWGQAKLLFKNLWCKETLLIKTIVQTFWVQSYTFLQTFKFGVQSKTFVLAFVKTFWMQSKTFVQNSWVQSKTFVKPL
jgi:hypothetical protein